MLPKRQKNGVQDAIPMKHRAKSKNEARLNKQSSNTLNIIQLQNQQTVKMVTLCGYLDSLSAFVSNSLKKNLSIRQGDKKDFNKVFVQVPKRNPQIKNFEDDDPRVERI